MEINGKIYLMWNSLVEKKDRYIGGILEDFGDIVDKAILHGFFPKKTTITDITLKPNGKDSAYFQICGETFSCGFDAKVGGISGDQAEGWLTFSGYGGHQFRISEAIIDG